MWEPGEEKKSHLVYLYDNSYTDTSIGNVAARADRIHPIMKKAAMQVESTTRSLSFDK